MEKQWQWASATRVKIGRTDDPEVLLGQLLPGYSNDEALCLLVDTGGRIGLKKVNRTVEALLRFSKPHWRLALILECNEYWSVPASVWTLVNLEQLRLEYNNLDTLSPDIAKLVKLKKLCIGVNQFEDFPEAVCQLEQLEQLFVSYCRLSVLPASFASLRHLRHLALTSNKFAEFPEVICELRKLTMLHLNGNKLSSLPHSFANLRELRELDISKNCFKKFPTVLCQLSKLTILKIYSNGMRELPLAFTKLTKLSFLEVCMNEFTSIPLFLGDLPQLSNLNATYGQFIQSPALYCFLPLVQAILFRARSTASKMSDYSTTSKSVERSFD